MGRLKESIDRLTFGNPRRCVRFVLWRFLDSLVTSVPSVVMVVATWLLVQPIVHPGAALDFRRAVGLRRGAGGAGAGLLRHVAQGLRAVVRRHGRRRARRAAGHGREAAPAAARVLPAPRRGGHRQRAAARLRDGGELIHTLYP